MIISENTVAKYMAEMGLDARLRPKYRVQTTDSNHSQLVAPRLFRTKDGPPDKPRTVLGGDITYLRVSGKFYYFAVVLDLFNREVLGWSLSDCLESSLVVEALKQAIPKCQETTKVVFHSDRGSQYASEAFRDFLGSKKMVPSMSRKGNCYDNAYVESFFKTFKSDYFYRNRPQSLEELRAGAFEYLNCWYNARRLHSSLGYFSPIDYKRKVAGI